MEKNDHALIQGDCYLAAYDISLPRRLIAALKLTRAYAPGGQKPVYELFLTLAERLALVDDMSVLIDLDTDRFLLLRLDPGSRVQTLSKAVALTDSADFRLIGKLVAGPF